MRLHTTNDVGLYVRDARRRMGLTQVELAQQAGVTRRWVSSLERGRDRVDLSLVLRVLDVLDLSLDVTTEGELPGARPRIDLEGLIQAHLPVEPWSHPPQ